MFEFKFYWRISCVFLEESHSPSGQEEFSFSLPQKVIITQDLDLLVDKVPQLLRIEMKTDDVCEYGHYSYGDGGRISNYLPECSRVTQQENDERPHYPVKELDCGLLLGKEFSQ